MTKYTVWLEPPSGDTADGFVSSEPSLELAKYSAKRALLQSLKAHANLMVLNRRSGKVNIPRTTAQVIREADKTCVYMINAAQLLVELVKRAKI